MISLDLLREAMQPLIEVGKEELEFDAFGTLIVLRPLLPREEVAVQRQSAVVLEDNKRFEMSIREGELDEAEINSVSRASALDYFDRFRMEVIAHSVVQVGNLDLRNVEHIATGETLENGKPVKITKVVAVRQLVDTWSRSMVSLVFAKYGELMDRITKNSDKTVEDSSSDLDAEIERLEKRLVEAKTERSKRAAGNPNLPTQQVQEFVGLGNQIEESNKAAANLPSRGERRSVLPSRVPPPTPEPPPSPQYELPPEPKPPSAFDQSVGSFGDVDLESIAAEEERILAARQKKPALTPPVRDPLAQAKPAGTVQGVEAYRLPTEMLSERGRKQQESFSGKAQVNAPPLETNNPNFRPPNKR
jgi:hypothetical protein